LKINPVCKTKRWNFGDGTTSDKNSGIHFYNKPGYYQVSLIIDNKYTKSFPVMVNARSIQEPKIVQNQNNY
jgi:PKD repeat protein